MSAGFPWLEVRLVALSQHLDREGAQRTWREAAWEVSGERARQGRLPPGALCEVRRGFLGEAEGSASRGRGDSGKGGRATAGRWESAATHR